MTLDIRSGLTLFFFSTIFILVLFILFILLTGNRKWYLLLFTFGLFVLCLTFIVALFLPDGVFGLLIVQNFLYLFSLAILIFSLFSIEQPFRKRVFFTFIGIIALDIFLYFIPVIRSDVIRYDFLESIAVFFIFTIGSYFIFTSPTGSRLRIIVGSLTQAFAFFHLSRGMILILFYDRFDLFANNLLNVIFVISSNLLIIVGCVGFLLMVKESDEKIILIKNRIIQDDNHKLHKLNETINKLFYVIAHDLKGPVGRMKQLSQLLRQRQGDHTRDFLIDSLYDNSRNIHELLDNLLNWSILNKGEIQAYQADCYPKPLADECLELFKDILNNKNLIAINRLDDDLQVFADENMVRTVLRNLISNSIKFTRDSGKITIFSEQGGGDMIKIGIRDTGVGMSEEIVKRVLSPGSNYTTKGTGNESGTGLGLQICREFIQKNGGVLGIDSYPGQGSTFWFTLRESEQNRAAKPA